MASRGELQPQKLEEERHSSDRGAGEYSCYVFMS